MLRATAVATGDGGAAINGTIQKGEGKGDSKGMYLR